MYTTVPAAGRVVSEPFSRKQHGQRLGVTHPISKEFIQWYHENKQCKEYDQRYFSRSVDRTEASSLVNRTPLWEVSDDPNDPQPLCLAMLLQHQDPKGTSDLNQSDLTSQVMYKYGPARFTRTQELATEFCEIWRRDYLLELSGRKKWKKPQRNFQVEDLILVMDDRVKRNEWKTAPVSNTRVSEDGLVRTVDLILPPLTGSRGHRHTSRPV